MKKIFTSILLGTLLVLSCKPITGPKGHAIVFGIETYIPYASNLSLTIDDADSVASLLAMQGWTVQLITETNATKINLDAALKTLANSDLPVLFYYSGHGDYREAGEGLKYYIATYGALTSEFLTNPDELNAMFANNNIKHGIAILDSCNSGGFVSTDGTVSGVPADFSGTFTPVASLVNPAIDAYINYAQSNNVIVLSAAGAQELSWESASFGHGIFTYYLLKSAQYGDYDGDGFVSTVEAYAYASKALNANWNQSNSGSSYLPRFSGEPRDYLLFKTIK